MISLEERGVCFVDGKKRGREMREKTRYKFFTTSKGAWFDVDDNGKKLGMNE